MAGPGIVVVASMVTIWLAATTDDAVVADDYYKRGLSINHRLERVDRAAALGLEAEADIAADGRVRVALASPSAEIDAHPAVIVLGVAHATRAGLDRSVELVLGPDGTYDGRIEPLGTRSLAGQPRDQGVAAAGRRDRRRDAHAEAARARRAGALDRDAEEQRR